MSDYAVIIPIYKTDLTALEQIALTQCKKILSNYDIIIIKPEHLNENEVDFDLSFIKEIISFPNVYFKDVFSYNNLMLETDFYKTFLKYEYMLIYQLDAFVFTDKLKYWCNLGYDYIGAPWLREKEYPTLFKKFKEQIRTYLHRRYNYLDKHGKPEIQRQMNNNVGNGGFSLRKVSTFYTFCMEHSDLVNSYKNQKSGYFNEDMFWTIEVNRRAKRIIVPPYRKALRFSIETAPDRAIKMTGGELPFGCHAWDLHLDFWRPYFKSAGYDI
ncbi:DUF5672 family protein [Pedobacter sp. Leaf176]|uniref:DUF5672 family protein n=1 Tax=Pedobacter sp. Leaf176 TaxID=1736286 RepID=UPI0006F4B96F|nr:DUF5672 family protein [Pedobacter sp. Leaf176]KQR69680.1 hypothetical protein ASF92_13285 [Pedobacter sp. Leaf176]